MPHVLGKLALQELVELLVSVGFPVIEILFVVTITKILAESQILLEVIKYLGYSMVGFERGLAHVAVLLDVDGKIGSVSFILDEAAVLTIFGHFNPHSTTGIPICYLYI
jgi:hypothetical protein